MCSRGIYPYFVGGVEFLDICHTYFLQFSGEIWEALYAYDSDKNFAFLSGSLISYPDIKP